MATFIYDGRKTHRDRGPRSFTTTNACGPTTNVLLSTIAQIDQVTSAVTDVDLVPWSPDIA